MKDQINPDHYKQYPVEVIDMMISIWGKENTRMYCLMAAFKYRMRLGHKDNIDQEIKKEEWYLNKAEELKPADLKESVSDLIKFFTDQYNYEQKELLPEDKKPKYKIGDKFWLNESLGNTIILNEPKWDGISWIYETPQGFFREQFISSNYKS